MRSIVEGLPILFFVVFLKSTNPQLLQNWQTLFMASGLSAIGVIIFYIHRRWVFNRLLLGVNLYLVIGAVAFILKLTWLYQAYERLQASGMLLWILITGMVSMALTLRGFIGVLCANYKTQIVFSVYLLICTLFAFALSYYFRGNSFLSEKIPFIFLFIAQGLLRRQLYKKRPQPDCRISEVGRREQLSKI